MSPLLYMRRYWPLLMMLLVVAPLSYPGSNGAGMMSGQNLLVWGCVIMWAGIMWYYRAEAVSFRGLTVVLLVAGGGMTLPLLWTTIDLWKLNALPRLVGLWAGIGLLLLLLRTRFGFQGRAVLITALIVAGVLQALMVLVQLLFPLSALVQQGLHYSVLDAQGRVLGSFGQVNLLGSFLAVCAGATLWVSIFVPGRFRVAVYGVLTLILMALVLTRSRTGWLGGVLACSGVMWQAYGRRPWKSLIGCCLLGVVLSITVIHLQPQVRVSSTSLAQTSPRADTFSLDRMRGESRVRRLQMLRVTWSLIMQHPFAGNGLGSFERRWSDGLTSLGEVSATPERVTHPHNELLYIWCEGGVSALAGLTLAGVLWILPVISLRRWRVRKGEGAGLRGQRCYSAIWPLTLPLVIHTMTEYPFYLSALHFVLFLLLWRLALPDGHFHTRASGSIRDVWISVLACLIGLLLLVVCALNMYRLRAIEQNGFIHPPTLFLPVVSAVMQSDRLQFDRSVNLLIAFNHSRDVTLLQSFAREAGEYLSAHNDANLMDSFIRVENALSRTDSADEMQSRAAVSFPDDSRFFKTGTGVP